MNDNIKTQIISGAPVQICPICDIEGCRHIREAASQPVQPVAVKVKPLVWENFDAWSYWAKSVVGTYRVREINGVWRTTLDCEGGDRVQLIYEYMTDDLTPLDFEAAQLAAQADYDARIMAALDVQPLTGQDAARLPEIVALIEAVCVLGAMPEGYCFCSEDRIGDDSRQHEPECRDLRAAIKSITE